MPDHDGCHALSKKTLEDVAASGNQALVQVKENQPALLQQLRNLTETAPVQDQSYSRDDGHGRLEERLVETFDIGDLLTDTDWHQSLKIVIRTSRVRLLRNTKTGLWDESSEVAYYAASTDHLTAEQAGKAIRQHWGIENRNHYVRDVTLGEDDSRIRTNPGAMARMKSFALNILRASQIKNVSQATWENALCFDNILKLKGI